VVVGLISFSFLTSVHGCALHNYLFTYVSRVEVHHLHVLFCYHTLPRCESLDYNFCLQVFTFGSVPLKTYLPDGDIDLTAFSENQNLKDTWAHQVRDMLEREERNENAEFRVKEVQYIQAEVCPSQYS
jgi:hypothetical protein